MKSNHKGIENLKPIKPGEVRNPKGYPKGMEHSSTRLKRLLKLTQNLENPITGEQEGFSVLEQLDMQQILKAQKGDLPAYKEVMDRLEGKSKESIDLTHSGEVQFMNNVPRPNKDN